MGVGMAERTPPPRSLLITCCHSPAPCVSPCGWPVCSSHCVQGRAGEEASNLLAGECGLTAPAHCPLGPREILGSACSLPGPGDSTARTCFWFLLHPSDIRGVGPASLHN